MSFANAILGVLVVVAIVAAGLIVVADLRHDDRPVRRWAEALVPLAGLLVLVVLVWAGR